MKRRTWIAVATVSAMAVLAICMGMYLTQPRIEEDVIADDVSESAGADENGGFFESTDEGEVADGETSSSGTVDSSDAVAASQTTESPGSPPVDVPDSWTLVGSETTSTGAVWTYETTDDVDECALAVLEILEESGSLLEEAGFLDLSGSAWGCVVEMQDGETALIVSLIPESYSTYGESSQTLVVTLTAFYADVVAESVE